MVVIVSQVTRGSVNMDQYATGQALKNLGVISGYDMTIEGIASACVTNKIVRTWHMFCPFLLIL